MAEFVAQREAEGGGTRTIPTEEERIEYATRET
jgi:hypothetical protein